MSYRHSSASFLFQAREGTALYQISRRPGKSDLDGALDRKFIHFIKF